MISLPLPGIPVTSVSLSFPVGNMRPMIHTPPLMQDGWDLSLSLLSETLCHGFTSALMPPCDQNSYLLGSISNVVKLNGVTCAMIKEGHGEGWHSGANFLGLLLGASQSEEQLHRYPPWPPGWQAPFHVPSRGAPSYSHFTEQETKA